MSNHSYGASYLFHFPAVGGKKWTYKLLVAGLNTLMGENKIPLDIVSVAQNYPQDPDTAVHVQTIEWGDAVALGRTVVSLSRTFNGAGQVSKPYIVVVRLDRQDIADVIASWCKGNV